MTVDTHEPIVTAPDAVRLDAIADELRARLQSTGRDVRVEGGSVLLFPERPPRIERPTDIGSTPKGTLVTMRRFVRRTFAPLAVVFSLLTAAPTQAAEQLDRQRQDRPIARRRVPEGQRRNALAFVRTELFFGTAKPGGVVTEDEFNAFLDQVVTPLFPDGLTVIKADGQFRGEDGVTIKEDSFVLILLYPFADQKSGSRNIDAIREAYVGRFEQESVLRVDDPFLVWVAF
jgi:hypothetical protein